MSRLSLVKMDDENDVFIYHLSPLSTLLGQFSSLLFVHLLFLLSDSNNISIQPIKPSRTNKDQQEDINCMVQWIYLCSCCFHLLHLLLLLLLCCWWRANTCYVVYLNIEQKDEQWVKNDRRNPQASVMPCPTVEATQSVQFLVDV